MTMTTQNASLSNENPSGAKARRASIGLIGTTEVVPFHKAMPVPSRTGQRGSQMVERGKRNG
jgi:hypothetical protein